ncbi:MAG: hypothetical protein JNM56_26665 [Planctomycetia bacterium]|nr:hypothetical protein [Planctomycetia bacterium]
MGHQGNGVMGQVFVEFTVANNRDVQKAAEGTLSAERVRRVRLKGMVDTGANYLVLPEAAVTQLDLPAAKPILVRFGDGRLEVRNVVEEARVDLLDRQGTFRAIVEPQRADALIGAIVLEDLDLLVDCSKQTLLPRDPQQMHADV